MKQKYENYNEFILNELMYIDSMFELYIHIYNERNNRIDVLNIAPAFFGLAKKSFLECASIRLCKIYDIDKKAITIGKYLNFIEQNNKNIFHENVINNVNEQVRKDKSTFQAYSEKIARLKSIRDKSLAHNDMCNIEKNYDIWEDSGLTIGDMKGLIKFGSEIVNHYLHLSDNRYSMISAVNKFDVDYILDILEKSDCIQHSRDKNE